VHDRTLLYENVVDTIKARIAEGVYRPGERLPSVKALADELNVGTSTVREGLRVLESAGLLQVQHGRGTFVTTYPGPLERAAQARELNGDTLLLSLLEMRRIIEPEAAALAAERATPEQVQAIIQAAAEQEQQIQRSGADAVPAEMALHRLLVEAAHNPVLRRMLESVNDLLVESRRTTGLIPTTYAKSVHYHYLIAHAVEARDARRARSLMLEHINDLGNDVTNHLKARG
jgi:GntR family transcriptional regulator, transcriptional repressor for pyruvate dehydrogenase complex